MIGTWYNKIKKYKVRIIVADISSVYDTRYSVVHVYHKLPNSECNFVYYNVLSDLKTDFFFLLQFTSKISQNNAFCKV